jgi:glucose/arabinose dehydrogenase
MRSVGVRLFVAGVICFLLAFCLTSGQAQQQQEKKKKNQPKRADKVADNRNLPEPPATPVASLKVAKGFKVELLYSVPKSQEGSWVNLCVDPKGRLIT